MITKDITKEIIEMHNAEVFKRIEHEVEEEFKSGVPAGLQAQLDTVMDEIRKKQQINTTRNVVSLEERNIKKRVTLAEIHLMAASGQSLSDWFGQPLNAGGGGFIIDIRRQLGTDDGVDIEIRPNESQPNQINETFSDFAGKKLNIRLSSLDQTLLKAYIRVNKEANHATGQGHLISKELDRNKHKGSITLEYELED